MATTVFFDGRKIKLPGVYSTIKSGINNPPQISDYSTCLIIDTGGEGATWGGGAGINGEHADGADAVYYFDTLQDFKAYIKGGLMWKVGEALFKPDGSNLGISRLYYVRACTTVAASMTFTATGGGAAGGTFKFDVKDEGVIGNGVTYDGVGGYEGGGAIGGDILTDDVLIKGYAYTIETGVIDTDKFIFKVWLGTYTGIRTSDYISYGEDTKAATQPILVAQSPEFDNIQDLIDWADTDETFNTYFVKDASSVVTGVGTVDSDDVSGVTGYNIAVGGTETYGTTDLTDALNNVKDLNYVFLLCDKYGTTDYSSASVGAIQSHIETEARYDKYMFYGAGSTKTQFSTSLTIAGYFDSNKVITVHSDVKKVSNVSSTGFRQWETLYHAALVLGRTAGLPPQVPVTFKSIGIEGLIHNTTSLERERALDGGVLITYFDIDFNNFIVCQDINSIQNNNNLINADGKSHSIQIERIKCQINKDLVINAKQQLLGQPFGVNRNTLSINYLKNWTEAFLDTKKATSSNDNLLIDWRDVTVSRVQDTYYVTYGIVPNTEITKLLMTGYMLDN